jgi:hypothetical protein
MGWMLNRLVTRLAGAAIVAAAVVIALALPAPVALAADAPSREYQVKAAFLYNFAQFVDWPDDAFAGADAPVVITIVGPNPFGTAVEQVTRGKTVRGRAIAVRYAPTVAAVGRTHVLFVADADVARGGQALREAAAAAGGHALTIADDEQFTAAGGVIRFFTEENKLRFEINTAAAGRAGLKVSAKLLQLARVYREN